jgi:hypothetical protein
MVSMDVSTAPLRRFILTKNADISETLKNKATFIAWAEKNSFNAIIFPLAVFASGNNRSKLKQLKQFALERGINLEAGGWDLSSLVPRWYFLFQKDTFRMEEGKRKKDHHFCPTSLNAIRIIGKTGKKIFQMASGIDVFHLWPDKGAETVWCSCPTCRAFTSQEQNCIAVNTAADVLATVNPTASITYFETSNETGNITLRKNIYRLESLPTEKESFNSSW